MNFHFVKKQNRDSETPSVPRLATTSWHCPDLQPGPPYCRLCPHCAALVVPEVAFHGAAFVIINNDGSASCPRDGGGAKINEMAPRTGETGRLTRESVVRVLVQRALPYGERRAIMW